MEFLSSNLLATLSCRLVVRASGAGIESCFYFNVTVTEAVRRLRCWLQKESWTQVELALDAVVVAMPARAATMRARSSAAESPGSPSASDDDARDEVEVYKQGDRCVVKKSDGKSNAGIVQFVGEMPSMGLGTWVGVQHDEPVGFSNGRLNGRRYFDCPPRHGGFYRQAEVDFEPVQIDDGNASDESPPQSPASKRPSPTSRDAAGSASPPPKDRASAVQSRVAGRGLHTAIVNQLAQFVITAFDAYGERRSSGSETFSVAVRGVNPPSNLRTKLHDHGNGTYTVEYRAATSGQLRVHVWLDGQALPESPYTAEAVTLRPEASRCVLRGEALVSAVARKPQAFEIDYVDALGHVAYAEELDVRVVPVQPLPTPPPSMGADVSGGNIAGGGGAAGGGEDGGESGSHDAERKSRSATDDAAAETAMEERLAVSGVLRVTLRKAMGLDSADLNGKSDPCAQLVSILRPHALVPSLLPSMLPFLVSWPPSSDLTRSSHPCHIPSPSLRADP